MALNVMFATSFGNIRRNELSDFVQINRGGKIAMKPDEDERIIGVETCGHEDDVLLTTSDGRAIRFPVDAVRVFRSRNSTGVRGIKLAEGAEVISLAILRHSDATPAERNTYLRQAAAIRRAAAEEGEAEDEGEQRGRQPDQEHAPATAEHLRPEQRAQESLGDARGAAERESAAGDEEGEQADDARGV